MALGSDLSGQAGLAEEVYTNAVQTVTITGTPTGGTFKLTYDGAQTAAIAFNAAAAAVQTALQALPNVGTGGITCTGGPLPGTGVVCTFVANGLQGRSVPLMTADSTALTGGASPTAAAAMTTPGTGYGDFVVPTRFLELQNESLKLDIQNIDSTAIRSGNRGLRTDRRIRNRKGAAGDLNFEVGSKGFGLLFKHMLGNAPVITTPVGATNARLQTYTIGDPKSMSLVVQIGVPDVGATVRPFSYKGVKFVSWKLVNDVDGILQLTITTDGKDEDLAPALAAASYAANFDLLSYVGGSLTINGTNIDYVTHFELSGVVGYKTDRYGIRSSTLKKEPVPVKLYQLSGSITAEFNDRSLYDLFVAGTAVPITANWNGQTLIDAGGSGFYGGLKVTLPACVFNGNSPDVKGSDLQMIDLPFDVLNDGVNPQITLGYTTLDVAA
jgi:hypothetical protein